MRTIATRLREYFGNRRRSPRFRVRVNVKVSPSEGRKKPTDGGRPSTTIGGYTRDISAKGLALITPAIRVGDIYLSGGRTLEILIEIPGGPVVAYAVAVRYEKLDLEEEENGYLVGVKITEMSDGDRMRWAEYLSTL